jgi:lipoate---protein ligase
MQMSLDTHHPVHRAVEVIALSGHDPRANLAFEERLFAEVKARPRPVCLFYVNDPCVVVGRTNRLEDWVYADAVQGDSLPLVRRFSGGGAVYHDRDCLNYSFLLPKSMLEGLLGRRVQDAPSPSLYIGYFRGLVIRALTTCGGSFSPSAVSDISLEGFKISGNAQRISAQVVLHHGTVLTCCPLAAYERYLPIPPNRPGVPHSGFVNGLRELGCQLTVEQLRQHIAEEFTSVCNAKGLVG